MANCVAESMRGGAEFFVRAKASFRLNVWKIGILCVLIICLPLLPKKVDVGVYVYNIEGGKVENMYENMQHNIVCTTHAQTFPFILMALKPWKFRKPVCVPAEAKAGILITQCTDNTIPYLLQNCIH